MCLNIFGEKYQTRPRTVTVMAHLYSIDFVICVGHLAENFERSEFEPSRVTCNCFITDWQLVSTCTSMVN